MILVPSSTTGVKIRLISRGKTGIGIFELLWKLHLLLLATKLLVEWKLTFVILMLQSTGSKDGRRPREDAGGRHWKDCPKVVLMEYGTLAVFGLCFSRIVCEWNEWSTGA